MAIDLFQIDKAGDDSLTKNYSVAVILNKVEVFGFRVPQKIQDSLINEFNRELLGLNKKDRLRFKLRFHTSIIILIIKEIIKKKKKLDRCQIEICNDYDGHLHEIRDMVLKNLKNESINLEKRILFSKDLIKTL